MIDPVSVMDRSCPSVGSEKANKTTHCRRSSQINSCSGTKEIHFLFKYFKQSVSKKASLARRVARVKGKIIYNALKLFVTKVMIIIDFDI